jgi:hypothetical protein
MKIKIQLFLFIFVLFNVSAVGQTASDFENKYGSQKYYEIRPKILMSAEYSENGQVCRVRFQPNRISEKTNTIFLGQDSLDSEQLKEAFDEIFPMEQRQGQLTSKSGSMISGGMFWGTLDYENIGVGLKGSLQLNSKNRKQIDACSIFGKDKQNDSNLNGICSIYGSLEIVTVHWTNRVCAGE